MGSSGTGADVEFSDYGEVLRRRWWLIALGLLCGAALAALAFAVVPKTYTSTASVIVRSTGEDGAVQNGRTSSDINLDTEAQIVTSTVVAKLALQELGEHISPRELAKRVTVSVPPNTSVLDISFSAPTAKEAQGGARAFAQAYLKNRGGLAESRISGQSDTLQKRIDTLGSELRDVGKRIAALPDGSPEKTYKSSQRDLLVQQIAALNSRYLALTADDIIPGDIITAAQLPTQPSDPNAKLLIASGLFAGLLAGALAAFIVDRADKRIRDRRDLERLGLDTLVGHVTVPALGAPASWGSARSDAESLRQLRNTLLAQMPGKRGSIMVAAMSSGDTGSAVAVNLSVTFARSGMRVILVSADTQSGAVSASFDTAGLAGLADVLQGRAEVDDVMHDVPEEPGLAVISPGSDGSLYSELLQNAQVQAVFNKLTAVSDLLVVDVAPLSENADAQTIATLSGGVVLVAAEKQTTRAEAIDAIDQLTHVSARVLGAVVAHVVEIHAVTNRYAATVSDTSPREVSNDGEVTQDADTSDGLSLDPEADATGSQEVVKAKGETTQGIGTGRLLRPSRSGMGRTRRP